MKTYVNKTEIKRDVVKVKIGLHHVSIVFCKTLDT